MAWVGNWDLQCHVSNEKNPGYLEFVGDEILPSYIGILIIHCKDPYYPTSIMESWKGFFRGSCRDPKRLNSLGKV